VDHRPVFDGPIDGESFSSSAQPGPKPFFLPKYSPDLNPIEQVFAKL
jgi:transposase